MSQATEKDYLRHAVMTATPEQLQLMLYDGVIRYASQAKSALESNDYEASHDRLTRAQNIMLEMQSGLNYDVNPALCRKIASVYNFLYRKLIDANVHRDLQAVDDALKVLRIERETWRILVDKVGRMRPAGPSNEEEFTPAAECPTGFTAEV